MAAQPEKCAHKVDKFVNRKRIVVCCDGTWNSANDSSKDPTNVVRLSGAVAHKCCSGMPQIVYYHSGAGTEASKTASYLGGILGLGVAQDIVETYRFICDNYNPGDEIIIVGFSRGAFTARSIAGMVCALGFLNRAGLDQLPCIFKDYETWQDWGKVDYDPNMHLVGFTLNNLKRVKRLEAAAKARAGDPSKSKLAWDGTSDDLEKELEKKKKDLFETMSRMFVEGGEHKKQMDLRKMAKAYRDMLVKHQMTLTRRIPNGLREPLEGKVKAVGVWDTVGSLGIPRMPYQSQRKEQEIRFESLNVHPHVEYAFHAIALDEWRSSFDCTMWDQKSDNTTTHLRQVWFPGSHCNVGGGWPDQQIATIALAWMCDQLTSIGVEFSKAEMNRIFYELRPGARAHEWGLAPIRDPSGTTTYPDRIWGVLAAPYRKYKNGNIEFPTRRPGSYTEDHSEDDFLDNPNELVHPSVRIRYLYGGLGPEDAGPYQNRSLVARGFELKSHPAPQTPIRPSRAKDALESTYPVVGGHVITPFYDTPNPTIATIAAATQQPQQTNAKLVRVEQPHEIDDLYQLPAPQRHWVWVGKNSKDEPKVLPEEHIGMWERLFIKNNEKMLEWQAEADVKLAKSGTAKSGHSCTVIGKTRAEEMKSKEIPETYGYHDFVSWQTADLTKNI